jgi:hypothetical protein
MQELDISQILKILSQFMQPPFQIIQRELSHRWTFAVTHVPSEHISEDEPPVRLEERADRIVIDGLLGQYDPATQSITIFRKGIDGVAKILKARPEDLAFVVRLHEWAHALLHVKFEEGDRLTVTRDESVWPEYLARATDCFQRLDPTLQERIPQLLTHHGLRSLHSDATQLEARVALGRITQSFEELTRRLSAEYQIRDYVAVPKGRLVKSIGLLKNGTLIGAGAWETVITW